MAQVGLEFKIPPVLASQLLQQELDSTLDNTGKSLSQKKKKKKKKDSGRGAGGEKKTTVHHK
jgi:hypothetical protein